MNCLITKKIDKLCETQVAGIKKLEIANIEPVYGQIDPWIEIPFYTGSASWSVNIAVVNPDLKHYTHQVTGSLSMYQQDAEIFKEYSLAEVKFRITDNNGEVYLIGQDGMQATQFDYASGSAPTDLVGVTFTFEGSCKDAMEYYVPVTLKVNTFESVSANPTEDFGMRGDQPFRLTLNTDNISSETYELIKFKNFVLKTKPENNAVKLQAILYNAIQITFDNNYLNKTFTTQIDYFPGKELFITITDSEGKTEKGVFTDAVLNDVIDTLDLTNKGNQPGTLEVLVQDWNRNEYIGETSGYITFPEDRPWTISLTGICEMEHDYEVYEMFTRLSNLQESGFSIYKSSEGATFMLKGKNFTTDLNMGDVYEYGSNEKFHIILNYYPNKYSGLRFVYQKNVLSVFRNSTIGPLDVFNWFPVGNKLTMSYSISEPGTEAVEPHYDSDVKRSSGFTPSKVAVKTETKE